MEVQIVAYGREVMLDLHNCSTTMFNRKGLRRFFKELCDQIGMVRADLYFWDYKGDAKGYKDAPPHLKGTSACQFIMTSNIMVHTLDDLHRVYLNIFSCKDFDPNVVKGFCEKYFEGTTVNMTSLNRL